MRVVWFKRDLRVHDHAALAAACASGEPVLPLYILEPALWQQPELSGRQFAFLLESLHDLDAALQRRGARLVLRVGAAQDVLAALHQLHGVSALHAHEETGLLWTYQRDKAVRKWAKQAGVPVIEARQHGVWRAHGNRNGWAARWDAMMQAPSVPAPAHIRFADVPGADWPDATGLGLAADPCPQRQPGGRAHAVRLLNSFLDHRGRTYRTAMSTPLEGASACSRLSAHLALGSLSVREAYQAAQRAQLRWRVAGDQAFAASIRSFTSRLHWHCHFIQKLEDEPALEHQELHSAYVGLRPVTPEHSAITQAWISGRTGFPFMDACMRSLQATGWLNFRMRAMVMAFSSYHLWQDWRFPAQALARQFTDFEPGIHYPQAQMQSGVTGVNTARIYNPVKQGHDQDADGVFIRRWVPELAHLPTPFVHEPWRAPDDLGPSIVYPTRLVDHEAAARFARAQIYSVRRGAAYRDAASAIQAKHGSRKSGLARTARRTSAKPKTQAEFDFS
jgi:deoxyribodipyrimidine photo-lyase